MDTHKVYGPVHVTNNYRLPKRDKVKVWIAVGVGAAYFVTFMFLA